MLLFFYFLMMTSQFIFYNYQDLAAKDQLSHSAFCNTSEIC